MSVRIIDNDCRIENGGLVIVVEGDNPEEVLSSNAKVMAMEKAKQAGYARVGVNKQSGSFPVDANGKAYEDWNKQAKDGLISAYRNEITLIGGL